MSICINKMGWYYKLSTVFLGLRTAVRVDTDRSLAESIFGQALRIPGDFCAYEETDVTIEVFINEFRNYLKEIKVVPAPHKSKKMPPQSKPFWFKYLDTCSHVLKLIKVKSPLVRPYTGPHKVLERHPSKNYYKIEVNVKPWTISTDLLKHAYFIPDLKEFFEIIPFEINEDLPEQTINPEQIAEEIENPFIFPDITEQVNETTPKTILKNTQSSDKGVQSSGQNNQSAPVAQPKKVRFVPNILRRKKQ